MQLIDIESELGSVRVSADELQYLRSQCTYLNPTYLHFLESFRLRPKEQVELIFNPVKLENKNIREETREEEDNEVGDLEMLIKGKWVDVILYEIPLLALTSEAYFRFVDRDWDYEFQEGGLISSRRLCYEIKRTRSLTKFCYRESI
jgi:nicotinate phosphoribosyltransferase